jgi:hypothetical protein
MKRIAALAALFLCMFARDGFVGQVIPEHVNLEQLVQVSGFIVVAAPADPPARTKELSIGWFKPSYTLYLSRFLVREVLAGSDPRVAAGKTIEVHPHRWKWKFESHRDYYNNGIDASPYLQSYATSVRGEAKGDLIIFLCANADDELEYAVERAYEAPSKRDEVRRLLEAVRNGK